MPPRTSPTTPPAGAAPVSPVSPPSGAFAPRVRPRVRPRRRRSRRRRRRRTRPRRRPAPRCRPGPRRRPRPRGPPLPRRPAAPSRPRSGPGSGPAARDALEQPAEPATARFAALRRLCAIGSGPAADAPDDVADDGPDRADDRPRDAAQDLADDPARGARPRLGALRRLRSLGSGPGSGPAARDALEQPADPAAVGFGRPGRLAALRCRGCLRPGALVTSRGRAAAGSRGAGERLGELVAEHECALDGRSARRQAARDGAVAGEVLGAHDGSRRHHRGHLPGRRRRERDHLEGPCVHGIGRGGVRPRRHARHLGADVELVTSGRAHAGSRRHRGLSPRSRTRARTPPPRTGGPACGTRGPSRGRGPPSSSAGPRRRRGTPPPRRRCGCCRRTA